MGIVAKYVNCTVYVFEDGEIAVDVDPFMFMARMDPVTREAVMGKIIRRMLEVPCAVEDPRYPRHN